MRNRLDQIVTKLTQIVEAKRYFHSGGKGPDDGPVLTRIPGRKRRAIGILDAPFRIHVDTVFLSVGGTRQNDIGMMRPGVTMMPLIDYKRAFQTGKINLVRTKQPHKIKLTAFGSLIHTIDIKA